MRTNTVPTVTTFSLLGLACVVSFLLPNNLTPTHAAAASAASIRLPGVVRDFRRTNTNFNVAPSGGNGHYAGNISRTLGAEYRPTFTGAGYKVATQWRDLNGRPIPPHLYLQPSPAVITTALAPITAGAITLDTYSSWAGLYTPLTAGPAPTWQTGSPMPAIPPAPAMPLSADYLRTSGPAGVYTLSTSMRVSKFEVTNGNVVRINGNITIVAQDLIKLSNSGDPGTGLELTPGSTLTIYAYKDLLVQDRGRINYPISGDPSRCTIYVTGATTPTLQNQASVCANIIAPNALLQIQDGSNFYGRITAKQVRLQNNAGIHIDTGRNYICNTQVNDTAGSKGANSTGGIVSAAAFDTWYQDVLGVNLSNVRAVYLVDNGAGIYQFGSDEFHPIDNQLFGNEGQAHNYYFTFAFETRFTFDACSGQFFEFRGSDDAWIFVGEKLAIDLGGVMPGIGQYVDMDRLSLNDGQTYTMRVFYAQRNSTVSRFHMRTNIQLDGDVQVTSMSAGVD